MDGRAFPWREAVERTGRGANGCRSTTVSTSDNPEEEITRARR